MLLCSDHSQILCSLHILITVFLGLGNVWMRLILRLSLVGSLTVVFLILYAVRSSRRAGLTLEQRETGKLQMVQIGYMLF